MNKIDYAPPTGQIRVLEKRLLNESILKKVMATDNLDEIYHALEQFNHTEFSTYSNDPEKAFQAVKKKLIAFLATWKTHSSLDALLLLDLTNEYHNLKVSVKEIISQQQYPQLYLFSNENDRLVNRQNFLDQTSNEFVDFLLSRYEKTKDIQLIDILIDQAMFTDKINYANEIASDFIISYIKFEAEFYNIKTLFRVKLMNKGVQFLREVLVPSAYSNVEFFIDLYDQAFEHMAECFQYKEYASLIAQGIQFFLEHGNFSTLEKLCDNFLISYLKESKYIASGPEIIFSYIMFSLRDIQTMRFIIYGKQQKLKDHRMEERLRDVYA